MHKLAYGQRGMTAIGWLIVLGLIAFFALLVLRLAPAYLEYFKVETSLESLQQEPGMGSKPSIEIRKLLDRRFDMNDIESVDAKDAEMIIIETKDGRTTVTADYEVRVPMMGNVDAVITFTKSIQVVAR